MSSITYEEIEIEFKHLLTREQFRTLLTELPFPETPFKQINYYFETKEHELIEKKCALRIRYKNDQYQGTFKEPHPDGILETHDHLTKEEADQFIQDQSTRLPHIQKRLELHNIHVSDLLYIGSLTTERYTYDTGGLEYVLDRSSYGNHIDYELEIEAPSYNEGAQAYEQIVEQFQLPSQQPITKIERFLKAMLPK